MKPIDRPRTNRPLSAPFLRKSPASSSVKAPEPLSRSQNEAAIAPSTLRMSVLDFWVVTSSTARA